MILAVGAGEGVVGEGVVGEDAVGGGVVGGGVVVGAGVVEDAAEGTLVAAAEYSMHSFYVIIIVNRQSAYWGIN